MRCRNLFSEKDKKKNITNLLSAKLAKRVVMVKTVIEKGRRTLEETETLKTN